MSDQINKPKKSTHAVVIRQKNAVGEMLELSYDHGAYCVSVSRDHRCFKAVSTSFDMAKYCFDSFLERKASNTTRDCKDKPHPTIG